VKGASNLRNPEIEEQSGDPLAQGVNTSVPRKENVTSGKHRGTQLPLDHGQKRRQRQTLAKSLFKMQRGGRKRKVQKINIWKREPWEFLLIARLSLKEHQVQIRRSLAEYCICLG